MKASYQLIWNPPQFEEAQGQDPQPSTSTGITGKGQAPITDVSAVSKPKGRTAKRARHTEEITTALNTNSATTYLNLATEELVSKQGSSFPAYLLKPAPTTLGIEELRKHGIISDIEKNHALTRMANAFIKIAPHLQNFLKKIDPTLDSSTSANDHAYHAADA